MAIVLKKPRPFEELFFNLKTVQLFWNSHNYKNEMLKLAPGKLRIEAVRLLVSTMMSSILENWQFVSFNITIISNSDKFCNL